MKKFTLILMAAATLCTSSFAQNKVKRIYTSSEKLNLSALETPGTDAIISRTLFAGYNSICLPMTLTAEQLQQAAQDIQVERLVAIEQEGSTLNLFFMDCTSEGIEAGMPYLIFSPKVQTLRANTANSKSISTVLQSVTKRDDEGNQVTFGSSWETLKIDGRYGIPAQQDTYILESVLEKTDGEKAFLPTRCGFTWDSQSITATDLNIKHVASMEGMETDIKELQAQNAIVDVYDTQGKLIKKQISVNQATQTLPSGIYVIGGQKVAVK